MINPLDALSSLTQMQLPTTATAPTSPAGVNFTTLTPVTPGAPVSEAFQNMLQPSQGVASASAMPATSSVTPSTSTVGGDPSTWGHMVQRMVMDVNSQQQTAAAKVEDVLKGGPTPIHDAMVSSEEASLSFELLAEMRNKVVDAYQQVMQMQV
jgi:flagellar hook-basal body complex protein FliE